MSSSFVTGTPGRSLGLVLCVRVLLTGPLLCALAPALVLWALLAFAFALARGLAGGPRGRGPVGCKRGRVVVALGGAGAGMARAVELLLAGGFVKAGCRRLTRPRDGPPPSPPPPLGSPCDCLCSSLYILNNINAA